MFQALCEASASSGPCGDRFSNVTAVGGCAACTKERRWLADGQTRGRLDPAEVTELLGGSPTIVPEDDPREALNPGDRAAIDFENFKD